MKPYKILCMFMLLCYSVSAHAQLVLYKAVVASGSGNYTSTGLSADWTVGQTVANQYTSTGLTITEGFHPVFIATPPANGIANVESNIVSAKVYPNPTNDILHISLEQHEAKTVTIQVLDINGKVVQNIITLPSGTLINTEVNMSGLSAGNYIIMMNANTADAYTMKVTKQ